MEPEASQPPLLTAKDVEKVEALIDPEPLECGGRGIVERLPNGRPVPRTLRWSFGKRSTFAVARLHLGMGWSAGILRRTCPLGIDRCVTHRTDDPSVPLPFPQVPDQPSNGVTTPQNRAPTPPDGNGPSGAERPEETLLRGKPWATGVTPASQANPTPQPRQGAPSPPSEGLAPGMAPTSGTWHHSGDNPPAPKRGRGVERHPGAAGAKVPRPPRGQRLRRRARKLLARRGYRARAAKTLAAVVVACALVFAVSRCTAALDRVELPPVLPPTNPVQAPTTPDPLLPPAVTVSSIGPVFQVCPPSWETTTAPIGGC